MADKWVNKIARQVHASPESDEYDLAGYSKTQCQQLGEEIFAQTFRVRQQFRISFIIGGGKEVRQKYDTNMSKWLTEVLRSHGYDDDNGASTANDCQKKFKYQEDTGKNVKRLHVFPSSEIILDGSAAAVRQITNEDKIIQSLSADFPKMLTAHVPTWLQHRRVQHILNEFESTVKAIESKMINSQALSEEEVELYNAEYADGETIKKKLNVVSKKMKHLVASGQLTPDEKEHLIGQAEEKLEAIEQKFGLTEDPDIPAVKSEQAPADIPEAVMARMNQVKSRIEKLSKIESRTIPLRHANAITKLWKSMKPLQNKTISGPNKRLILDKLPVMEAQVAELIKKSRDWFETQEELDVRVAALQRTVKGSKSAGSKGTSRKGKPMSKKQQLKAARGFR